MQTTAILQPMLALAGLTFFVLCLIPLRRVRAMRAGVLRSADFALGESSRVPAQVALPNRNFMNLLEQPVLFYVSCITFYVTAHGDALAVELAWAYVLTRALHSTIHLSYNRVSHRGLVAALGTGLLMLIWIRLGLALA